jgi:hypothetical protein
MQKMDGLVLKTNNICGFLDGKKLISLRAHDKVLRIIALPFVTCLIHASQLFTDSSLLDSQNTVLSSFWVLILTSHGYFQYEIMNLFCQ